MVKRKIVIIGVLLVTLISCASFKYRYYGFYPSKGLLLGDKPEHDLPVTMCEPDEHGKGKCWVFFSDELERMRADMIELADRLKACEQGHL